MIAQVLIQETMHRLPAKLLLLLALAPNFIPPALAGTAPPPHACCTRKAANHCHESAASELNQPSVRSRGCCNHDCCRAAITAQWAYAPPRAEDPFVKKVENHVPSSRLDSPTIEVSEFQSSRAPPTS